MSILVAKIGIFVVLMLLGILIVLKGPSKDRKWHLVQYSLIPKAFAITLFFLMSISLYSMSLATDVKTFVVAVVWLFFLCSIITLLEVYGKKIWFDQSGVYCQEFYGKRKWMRTDSIVQKKREYGGMKIVDSNNTVIHCSHFMSGSLELEIFIDFLLNSRKNS